MRTFALVALLALPAAAHEPWEMDDCGLQPPGSVLTPPVPRKPWEPVITPATPPLVRRVADVPRIGGVPTSGVSGQGALAGKVVYLSPGHGFTWTSTVPEWRTQRGNTNGIVEDLVSIETLSQFVMPMLLNAGARVIPVRELDLNPDLVIVDNGEAGYAEAGSGFVDSTLMSWGRPTFPLSGAALPFTLGTNRLMDAAPTATASATYTAQLPASGYYDVSVSYSQFTARVTDAHYVVRHAGGETHFRVNQQRHGSTWVQLGRFYFRQGGTAQVVVQNDSSGTGNVSLDAVKWGGGMGLTDRGAGVSGRPRFEESARYHTQFSGAPASVFAANGNTPADDRTNDVGARSRFAAWEHEAGEDAIYVAWHTNAFNGAAVGTDTYVYGPNPPDGNYQFTGVAGSDRLAQLVHGELVADIKAASGWNQPTWRDRGIHSAYFGELNPGNNPETPAILLEVAFHDSAADALHLREPGFRYLAARAIAQGIIRYFAEKDGAAVNLPSEPPTHVSAVWAGSGEATLAWRAPPTDGDDVRGDPATRYRVYASEDGLAWDNGVEVTGTSARVAVPSDAPRFFRVTGLNAGGESFPSATVGVRAPVHDQPRVLLVNGYARLEHAIATTESFPARYSLGMVSRVFIAKMNDGSYARVYGDALAANQVGFDSADLDAVASGDVAVEPYHLLTWFAGRGKQTGAAPSTTEQAVVKGFRMRNLPVFFTGNAVADEPFLSDVFQATVPAATGGTLTVDGADALLGLGGLVLDDGSAGTYNTGSAPLVAPSGSAVLLASYGSGGGAAALGTRGQSVLFGFPFETLVDRPQRVEVMRRVLEFLEPPRFDGGIEPDAGAPDADGGVILGPDGGLLRQPVLAFQGGGCSAAPGGLLGLVLLFVTARSRRRGAR